MVGEVADVGADVDARWIGRRVATRGRHAAWIVRPADDLRPLPGDVSDEEGTFATLSGVVMNGLRRAGLTWGESVAVVGLGLVGQLWRESPWRWAPALCSGSKHRNFGSRGFLRAHSSSGSMHPSLRR